MNPPLSPQQKRIKEAYQIAFWPTLIVCSVIWIALGVLSFVVSRALGGSGSSNLGGTVILVLFAAHMWTVRKLKHQGLSLASQKVEVLTRVTSEADGKAKEWRYPKTWLGAVGMTSFYFLLAVLIWFLWHWSSDAPWLVRGWWLFGFAIFLWIGTVQLIFIRSPFVRIDAESITAFPSLFWRRRVWWADVARCEIRSVTDYLGNSPSFFYNFQSAQGKSLLRLNPNSFSGLSSEDQAEIEREIRRRFVENGASE